jgi:hypothetical protein
MPFCALSIDQSGTTPAYATSHETASKNHYSYSLVAHQLGVCPLTTRYLGRASAEIQSRLHPKPAM